MKSKFLFAKANFGILFFTLLILGCKNKTESNIDNPKGVFNGLYTVNYKNSDMEYIWIFSNDMRYVLYSASTSNYLNTNNSINYESPTHYYIIGKKYYSCGIDDNMNATPLIECKNRKSDPRYNIISIDTIEDTYSEEKFQLIQLEDFYSKAPIKLRKKL